MIKFLGKFGIILPIITTVSWLGFTYGNMQSSISQCESDNTELRVMVRELVDKMDKVTISFAQSSIEMKYLNEKVEKYINTHEDKQWKTK